MILARAPLRIPLGGGGTDLPSYYSRYGGFVVSAAINKYVYIYVNRPAADNMLRVKYSRYEQVSSPDEVQHDLVRPALKRLGLKGSLEIVSMADVPDGTGLGSSSSYLVGLLRALLAFKREHVSAHALAEEACAIEIEEAGHPVGKQDGYVSAFGGIVAMTIAPDGTVDVKPVELSLATLEELRASLLLFYTGITRRASDILVDQRADTEAGRSAVIESLHLTKQLGYEIVDALERGDPAEFGRLMDRHWQIKKQRSGKISNPDIDRWYALARDNGALGGKILGAGGGGFFLFYCPPADKARLRRALEGAGLTEMFFDFDHEGAKVLVNF